MNQTATTQKFGTEKEAREQLKLQLAQHLEQQTESTLSLHKWMKRLEAAGAGIIAAAFVAALYLSIIWKSIHPLMIPVAWFAFAASAALILLVTGLDAVFLRAFPTSAMPGKSAKFVSGSSAVWIGFGFILLALATAAFWGAAAYATLTQNWAILQPMISFLGVAMAVGMLASMAQKIVKAR